MHLAHLLLFVSFLGDTMKKSTVLFLIAISVLLCACSSKGMPGIGTSWTKDDCSICINEAATSDRYTSKTGEEVIAKEDVSFLILTAEVSLENGNAIKAWTLHKDEVDATRYVPVDVACDPDGQYTVVFCIPNCADEEIRMDAFVVDVILESNENQHYVTFVLI